LKVHDLVLYECLIGMIECMSGLCKNLVFLHVETDWEPGIFAWASSSRLSENTRNSPLELREVSSRRAGFA